MSTRRGKSICLFICVALFYFASLARCSEQGDMIEKWANKLGKELYDLGQAITKGSEIKSRYSLLNAQVERKDPKQLLAEIVESISRMMDRKMDAIRCILEVAEDESEAYEYDTNSTFYYYHSSKFSPNGNDTYHLEDSLKRNREMYLDMELNEDSHFYNIAVNTSFSSVHVPINVYDRHKDAQTAIQWSEALDQVFLQNYNSDPALSWQYFGSSSGIMRHYPAMHWIEDDEVDLFDCRIRTWFIEAATCTKDVVILVDSSGSMEGMRKHIATLTVYSILDTFSNNDYINVMNYSTSFNYTVPCFENMLVQATKENIETFKLAVRDLDPENKSDATVALAEAFRLLESYRERRGCNENGSDCNQAIMLVTDGIAGNFSDVFEQYNRNYNGSIPVRIFTYLIGNEVTKVNEIMWAACSNRGYYAHVQSLEEVTGSVFKYIPVIARPLVLQGVEHPVSWTHAYMDYTSEQETENDSNTRHRLITSVAVPAFDRKINKMNDSRTADLLGVAATDVPLDDFRKLTLPYKIGVMGYAFIVSNNGYIVMHPAFRPVFNKTVPKINYNSVDFAEVEQHDDNLGPRQLNPTVLKLRKALVDGEQGSLHDARLKYHYDDMRRTAHVVYDYYYAPLVDTPFSIGLAVPDAYGNYSIRVGDEIQRNRHTGIHITSFFMGQNWKIHPKWVYCKYHYLEGHEFNTPESELLHFLERMYKRDFKWSQQYEAMEHEEKDDIECGRKTLDDDDYYCDRDLIQRLIFDAKNTMPAYEKPWKFNNDREEMLFKKYNATLRFVATMSGLTRWEYIYGEDENVQRMEFGDYHSRAIDETWYKAAVLQHQYDSESYVYSVPFEAGADDDVLVTGSYAIFPKDGGMEAPGSVVGYQFSHGHLHKRFLEITSHADSDTVPCSDMLDCYIVDSSGYILASNNINDTGFFFGEIEGAVMESMLKADIFEKVSIYDLQGYCVNVTYKPSAAAFLQTPLDLGKSLVSYMFSNLLWILFKTNLYQIWDPNWVLSEEFLPTTANPLPEDDEEIEEEPKEKPKKMIKIESYYPCDLERDLFILNQNKLLRGNGWRGEVPKVCSRSFFVKRVPHSNLIMVAVNSSEPQCERTYTTDPRDIDYPPDINHPCQKIALTTLPRRRLSGCFNEHYLETEITTCGRSTRNHAVPFGLFIIVILILQMF